MELIFKIHCIESSDKPKRFVIDPTATADEIDGVIGDLLIHATHSAVTNKFTWIQKLDTTFSIWVTTRKGTRNLSTDFVGNVRLNGIMEQFARTMNGQTLDQQPLQDLVTELRHRVLESITKWLRHTAEKE